MFIRDRGMNLKRRVYPKFETSRPEPVLNRLTINTNGCEDGWHEISQNHRRESLAFVVREFHRAGHWYLCGRYRLVEEALRWRPSLIDFWQETLKKMHSHRI